MNRRKLGPIRHKLGPIRDANAGKNAEFGRLSQCIIDVDPEILIQARRIRRGALVASVALQAVCVAALLILPLIAATNALPHPYAVTPVPPYRGDASARTPHLSHAIAHASRSLFDHPIVFSMAITHAPAREESGNSTPQMVGPGVDIGAGSNDEGFGIPSSIGKGLPIQPPRPAPPTQTMVHRSEGVMAGQLIHQVQPSYPEIARNMHLSGTVRLEAVIGTDGTIRDLEILSGNPILTRPAVEAVRQWRYRPTLLNGAPVEVETYVTVNFVLSE